VTSLQSVAAATDAVDDDELMRFDVPVSVSVSRVSVAVAEADVCAWSFDVSIVSWRYHTSRDMT